MAQVADEHVTKDDGDGEPVKEAWTTSMCIRACVHGISMKDEQHERTSEVWGEHQEHGEANAVSLTLSKALPTMARNMETRTKNMTTTKEEKMKGPRMGLSSASSERSKPPAHSRRAMG